MNVTPKFGIWRCKVLFILTKLSVADVARQAGIIGDPALYQSFVDTVRNEGWLKDKERFYKMPFEKREDPDILELFFKPEDDMQRAFITSVINAEKSASEKNIDDAARSQLISRMKEFMSEEIAEQMIANFESSPSAAPSANYGNVPQSNQEKIDAINRDYAQFARAIDGTIAESHAALRQALRFYSMMCGKMESDFPDDLSWNELVAAQRPASYTAQAIAKIVSELSSITGVSDYVKPAAAISKLKANRYHVISDQQLAEISRQNG
jgi:hypothetical protein